MKDLSLLVPGWVRTPQGPRHRSFSGVYNLGNQLRCYFVWLVANQERSQGSSQPSKESLSKCLTLVSLLTRARYSSIQGWEVVTFILRPLWVLPAVLRIYELRATVPQTNPTQESDKLVNLAFLFPPLITW